MTGDDRMGAVVDLLPLVSAWGSDFGPRQLAAEIALAKEHARLIDHAVVDAGEVLAACERVRAMIAEIERLRREERLLILAGRAATVQAIVHVVARPPSTFPVLRSSRSAS